MNENLNLEKILKNCPQGTKFYSILFGEVVFYKIKKESNYSIICIKTDGNYCETTSDGRYYENWDGECTLFPSKDQRDWSKFKIKSNKPKFDPKTLQVFDKVLVRDSDSENWMIQLFSHIIEGEVDYPYSCIINPYRYCIPCDGNTKHLLGTNEDAPKYYRYWED